MTRTLFFRTLLRKFSEITNNKPIFSQYNIFYNYEYFFFQSAFWSLFNHRQRSQSNQEQCSLCCSSPCFRVFLCTHYGPLQYFQYFRKLKEIGVLQPIFPDYVISCDYVVGHKPRSLKLSSLEPTPWQRSFYHLPYQYLSLISISLSTNLLLLLKFVLF